VTPPDTLVSCTPGCFRNRITHVSVPGPGTFLTRRRDYPNVHFSKSLHFREPRYDVNETVLIYEKLKTRCLQTDLAGCPGIEQIVSILLL
jgi:hypothetical protein